MSSRSSESRKTDPMRGGPQESQKNPSPGVPQGPPFRRPKKPKKRPIPGNPAPDPWDPLPEGKKVEKSGDSRESQKNQKKPKKTQKNAPYQRLIKWPAGPWFDIFRGYPQALTTQKCPARARIFFRGAITREVFSLEFTFSRSALSGSRGSRDPPETKKNTFFSNSGGTPLPDPSGPLRRGPGGVRKGSGGVFWKNGLRDRFFHFSGPPPGGPFLGSLRGVPGTFRIPDPQGPQLGDKKSRSRAGHDEVGVMMSMS